MTSRPKCCVRLATSLNTVQHHPTMLDDVGSVWLGLPAVNVMTVRRVVLLAFDFFFFYKEAT